MTFQHTSPVEDAVCMFEAWADDDHESQGRILRKYTGAEGMLTAALCAAGGFMITNLEAGRSLREVLSKLHAGGDLT